MGYIEYRERLAELPSAALDAQAVEALKQILRDFARCEDVEGLVQSVEVDAGRGYGRRQLLDFDRGELALVVLHPGQQIGAHDHGIYQDEDAVVGVVMVVEGVERNCFYTLSKTGELTLCGEKDVRSDEFLELTANLIHSVENATHERAVSLHAYIHAQNDPATGKRRF